LRFEPDFNAWFTNAPGAPTPSAPAPSPLPPIENGDAIEVERPVSRCGLVSLGPHRLLATEILGGQLVGIRIKLATLMFYDPATRSCCAPGPTR
jgi:hypothetical protein